LVPQLWLALAGSSGPTVRGVRLAWRACRPNPSPTSLSGLSQASEWRRMISVVRVVSDRCR